MFTALSVFHKILTISVLTLLIIWSPFTFSNEVIYVSNLKIAPAGFIENGRPQGIFYDIASRVITEAGYIPEIQLLPYPRVLENLTTGKADMSILIANEVIEKACYSLVPVSKVYSIIVGLKSNDYIDLNSLQGKTVGILRQAKYDDDFDKDLNIKKYQFNSYEQGIKMLFTKRFSAMIGTRISLYYTLVKQGYSVSQLGKPLVLNTKVISIQYSKKSRTPQAKHKMALATKRLISQGEIEKIIKRYGDF